MEIARAGIKEELQRLTSEQIFVRGQESIIIEVAGSDVTVVGLM